MTTSIASKSSDKWIRHRFKPRHRYPCVTTIYENSTSEITESWHSEGGGRFHWCLPVDRQAAAVSVKPRLHVSIVQKSLSNLAMTISGVLTIHTTNRVPTPPTRSVIIGQAVWMNPPLPSAIVLRARPIIPLHGHTTPNPVRVAVAVPRALMAIRARIAPLKVAKHFRIPAGGAGHQLLGMQPDGRNSPSAVETADIALQKERRSLSMRNLMQTTFSCNM